MNVLQEWCPAKASGAPTGTGLPKAVTGIAGLGDVTQGGFPVGRPMLACGGAGCGKTLLAAEFLVRGATQFGEAGCS
jgi:circadian clock protein KaiC